MIDVFQFAYDFIIDNFDNDKMIQNGVITSKYKIYSVKEKVISNKVVI